MEEIFKKKSHQFICNTNQEKNSNDELPKISYFSNNYKTIKKNNSKDKDKKLLDFISDKNKIIFKSDFDHKGAKRFLAEKEKAMEELTLIDETREENHIHNKKKLNLNKCKSSHKIHSNLEFFNHHLGEDLQIHHHKHHKSHINLNLNLNENYTKHEHKKLSSKNTRKNIKIKNTQKMNVLKKSVLESDLNSFKSSKINDNDNAFLEFKENDSLIYSILKELLNLKI